MKKALWWVGGLCAAATGFLVLGALRVRPVEALERSSEEAWRDEPAPAHADDDSHADLTTDPAHTLV